jgi:hypothetical protein
VKAYSGPQGVLLSLNLGNRWRWVVSFMLQPFYLQGITNTLWIGGWVGPRAGLDVSEKRNLLPLLEIEPWTVPLMVNFRVFFLCKGKSKVLVMSLCYLRLAFYWIISSKVPTVMQSPTWMSNAKETFHSMYTVPAMLYGHEFWWSDSSNVYIARRTLPYQ